MSLILPLRNKNYLLTSVHPPTPPRSRLTTGNGSNNQLRSAKAGVNLTLPLVVKEGGLNGKKKALKSGVPNVATKQVSLSKRDEKTAKAGKILGALRKPAAHGMNFEKLDPLSSKDPRKPLQQFLIETLPNMHRTLSKEELEAFYFSIFGGMFASLERMHSSNRGQGNICFESFLIEDLDQKKYKVSLTGKLKNPLPAADIAGFAEYKSPLAFDADIPYGIDSQLLSFFSEVRARKIPKIGQLPSINLSIDPVNYGSHADLWALGCCMYRLYTLEDPPWFDLLRLFNMLGSKYEVLCEHKALIEDDERQKFTNDFHAKQAALYADPETMYRQLVNEKKIAHERAVQVLIDSALGLKDTKIPERNTTVSMFWLIDEVENGIDSVPSDYFTKLKLACPNKANLSTIRHKEAEKLLTAIKKKVEQLLVALDPLFIRGNIDHLSFAIFKLRRCLESYLKKISSVWTDLALLSEPKSCHPIDRLIWGMLRP